MSGYTSSTEHLEITHADAILRLTFNRELLNYEMLENVTAAVEKAKEDSNVRVVALDVSALGDDADEMGEFPSALDGRQPEGAHGPGPLVEQRALRALRTFMKPTIGLIDGPLNGTAIDLASVCDVRIASERSTITDTRMKQGRAAATGISYVLPKLIGLSQAMRILLLGETLDAHEAVRIQFLHYVFPDEDFEERANELLARIAKMPTRAWEVHKLQVIPQLDQDFETAMVHSLGVRQTHVIEDRMEGMKAWRERRDPEFKGR